MSVPAYLQKGCFSMLGDTRWFQCLAPHPWVCSVRISPQAEHAAHRAPRIPGGPMAMSSASIEQQGSIGATSIYIRRGSSPKPSPPAPGSSRDRGHAARVKAVKPQCTCSTTAATQLRPGCSSQAGTETRVSEPHPCWHLALPGVTAGRSSPVSL